jgi:hypothetical protein
MQLLCLASSSDAGSTRYTVRILHVFSAPLSPKRSDASERHKCLDPLHAVGSVAPLYGDSSSLPALREAVLLVTPRLHYRPIATSPQRMPTHSTPYSIVWSLTSFLGQKLITKTKQNKTRSGKATFHSPAHSSLLIQPKRSCIKHIFIAPARSANAQRHTVYFLLRHSPAVSSAAQSVARRGRQVGASTATVHSHHRDHLRSSLPTHRTQPFRT